MTKKKEVKVKTCGASKLVAQELSLKDLGYARGLILDAAVHFTNNPDTDKPNKDLIKIAKSLETFVLNILAKNAVKELLEDLEK